MSGEPHEGYSGKIQAESGREYVVCERTHKSMFVTRDLALTGIAKSKDQIWAGDWVGNKS